MAAVRPDVVVLATLLIVGNSWDSRTVLLPQGRPQKGATDLPGAFQGPSRNILGPSQGPSQDILETFYGPSRYLLGTF